jgi:hypothetical protein
MLVSLLALEKKLGPMGKILGEFSEYISLKKLNNFASLLLINLGKCKKTC